MTSMMLHNIYKLTLVSITPLFPCCVQHVYISALHVIVVISVLFGVNCLYSSQFIPFILVMGFGIHSGDIYIFLHLINPYGQPHFILTT